MSSYCLISPLNSLDLFYYSNFTTLILWTFTLTLSLFRFLLKSQFITVCLILEGLGQCDLSNLLQLFKRLRFSFTSALHAWYIRKHLLLKLAPGPDTLPQQASEFIQKRSYWTQITGCSVCRIKVERLLQFQCTDRLSKILCHKGQEWNSWSERRKNEIVNWGNANWREMFKFRRPSLTFPWPGGEFELE